MKRREFLKAAAVACVVPTLPAPTRLKKTLVRVNGIPVRVPIAVRYGEPMRVLHPKSLSELPWGEIYERHKGEFS